MTRRSCLSALGGLSMLGCTGWREFARWRLLTCGLEFQLKTRDFVGAEKVYADWQGQDCRFSIEGSHCLGSDVLVKRPSERSWEQASLLLVYGLSTGNVATVEYPFGRAVETLTGVPGVSLVTAGSIAVFRLADRVGSGVFIRRTLSKDSEWELAGYDEGASGLDGVVQQRRMWPTGELGVVVYSARKSICRHHLVEGRRERMGAGDYASVSHDGKWISFLTSTKDIELAEFPSMKPVHTFAGPFRDGMVWAPHSAVGIVATPGTVPLGDFVIDTLWLVDANKLAVGRMGSHRMMVGSRVLRWIGGSEGAIARLDDLAQVVKRFV